MPGSNSSYSNGPLCLMNQQASDVSVQAAAEMNICSILPSFIKHRLSKNKNCHLSKLDQQVTGMASFCKNIGLSVIIVCNIQFI